MSSDADDDIKASSAKRRRVEDGGETKEKDAVVTADVDVTAAGVQADSKLGVVDAMAAISRRWKKRTDQWLNETGTHRGPLIVAWRSEIDVESGKHRPSHVLSLPICSTIFSFLTVYETVVYVGCVSRGLAYATRCSAHTTRTGVLMHQLIDCTRRVPDAHIAQRLVYFTARCASRAVDMMLQLSFAPAAEIIFLNKDSSCEICDGTRGRCTTEVPVDTSGPYWLERDLKTCGACEGALSHLQYSELVKTIHDYNIMKRSAVGFLRDTIFSPDPETYGGKVTVSPRPLDFYINHAAIERQNDIVQTAIASLASSTALDVLVTLRLEFVNTERGPTELKRRFIPTAPLAKMLSGLRGSSLRVLTLYRDLNTDADHMYLDSSVSADVYRADFDTFLPNLIELETTAFFTPLAAAEKSAKGVGKLQRWAVAVSTETDMKQLVSLTSTSLTHLFVVVSQPDRNVGDNYRRPVFGSRPEPETGLRDRPLMDALCELAGALPGNQLSTFGLFVDFNARASFPEFPRVSLASRLLPLLAERLGGTKIGALVIGASQRGGYTDPSIEDLSGLMLACPNLGALSVDNCTFPAGFFGAFYEATMEFCPKLKMLNLVQTGLPGIPSVYHGDETHQSKRRMYVSYDKQLGPWLARHPLLENIDITCLRYGRIVVTPESLVPFAAECKKWPCSRSIPPELGNSSEYMMTLFDHIYKVEPGELWLRLQTDEKEGKEADIGVTDLDYDCVLSAPPTAVMEGLADLISSFRGYDEERVWIPSAQYRQNVMLSGALTMRVRQHSGGWKPEPLVPCMDHIFLELSHARADLSAFLRRVKLPCALSIRPPVLRDSGNMPPIAVVRRGDLAAAIANSKRRCVDLTFNRTEYELEPDEFKSLAGVRKTAFVTFNSRSELLEGATKWSDAKVVAIADAADKWLSNHPDDGFEFMNEYINRADVVVATETKTDDVIRPASEAAKRICADDRHQPLFLPRQHINVHVHSSQWYSASVRIAPQTLVNSHALLRERALKAYSKPSGAWKCKMCTSVRFGSTPPAELAGMMTLSGDGNGWVSAVPVMTAAVDVPRD